jgi:hypothetical protein
MAMKARFIPKNPQKYIGNPNNILCRSSWEVAVCKFFDKHPGVLRWGSEEIAIPYIKPTDGRVHKYYPDFIAIIQESSGEPTKYVIEVKPMKETVLTEKSSNYDRINIAINEAKWTAARSFCLQYGFKFKILTEEQIFHQVKRAPKKAPVRRKK